MNKVYNPRSLLKQSRTVVNKHLKYVNDSDKLDIPRTLQNYLNAYWVNDKIKNIDDKINIANIEEYKQDYSFMQPNLQLRRDAFVAFMYWQPKSLNDLLEVFYEFNHVTYMYYTIERSTRWKDYNLCEWCMFRITRSIDGPLEWKLWRHCDIHHVDDILDTLQYDIYWCTACRVTTLFYIEDSPVLGHRWAPIECIKSYDREPTGEVNVYYHH